MIDTLRKLVVADLKFGAFLTALMGGWRDSNGKDMPDDGRLKERLGSEIDNLRDALEAARKELRE